MRVFVTGGTGFLGSHVVQEAVRRGHEVVVFRRPGAPCAALAGVPCTFVEGDLFSVDDLARAMDGCEAVLHMAGDTSWFRRDAARVTQVNVGGTEAVLDAMKRAGVARGVLTSSISAIGVSEDPGRPADEDTPWNWPEGFAYPRSKRLAEERWLDPARGLATSSVLPATIFGPGDSRMTTGVIFRKVAARSFPRLPCGGFSGVDVRDVAVGHLLALESGRPGRRYVLGGFNVRNEELVERVAAALGVAPPKLSLSPRLVSAYERVARAVEWTGLRLDVAAGHLWCMNRYVYHSWKRAARELGFEPRSMEATLADSIAWYRKEGLLR